MYRNEQQCSTLHLHLHLRFNIHPDQKEVNEGGHNPIISPPPQIGSKQNSQAITPLSGRMIQVRREWMDQDVDRTLCLQPHIRSRLNETDSTPTSQADPHPRRHINVWRKMNKQTEKNKKKKETMEKYG